ncbi:MAG: hypothetical protein ACRD1C_13525 [Terriglobales bacterium]
MAPKKVREAAAWMGRKSYRVRLERFGIERLREIARENGKLGGRPPKRPAGGK